jgi:hypothetical protein
MMWLVSPQCTLVVHLNICNMIVPRTFKLLKLYIVRYSHYINRFSMFISLHVNFCVSGENFLPKCYDLPPRGTPEGERCRPIPVPVDPLQRPECMYQMFSSPNLKGHVSYSHHCVHCSSCLQCYCIGGVMASVLVSSVVDRGFEPWLGQTKDN